ncbi:diguanylate cyclase [Acidobacteriota bacterium]
MAESIKVLIAEDNKVSRKILERSLEEWGYDVIIAGDGEEAWSSLQNQDIRMAILDWMMPKISGLDICRKVRENEKDHYTYLILLTAKGDQEDVVEGLTAGADDYITKPFNRHELSARLQTGRRIIKLESQLLDTQAELQKIATHDGLTQIWNRVAILNILDEEIERSVREKLPVGVIMIDIDQFKTVNDTHGHQAGDLVLINVANNLKNSLRPYDKIGRYGGDEILIVLPNCSLQDLEHVSVRLLRSVAEEKVDFDGKSIMVTISIGGISSESNQKISSHLMIQESDKALYRAKNDGRNRFSISDEFDTGKKGVQK